MVAQHMGSEEFGIEFRENQELLPTYDTSIQTKPQSIRSNSPEPNFKWTKIIQNSRGP